MLTVICPIGSTSSPILTLHPFAIRSGFNLFFPEASSLRRFRDQRVTANRNVSIGALPQPFGRAGVAAAGSLG